MAKRKVKDKGLIKKEYQQRIKPILSIGRQKPNPGIPIDKIELPFDCTEFDKSPRSIKFKLITTIEPINFQTTKHLAVNICKKYKCKKGQWVLSVWGADDIGMNIEGDMDFCLTLFDKLKDDISEKILLEFGFERF